MEVVLAIILMIKCAPIVTNLSVRDAIINALDVMSWAAEFAIQ